MSEQRSFNTIRVNRSETMITVIGIPDVPGAAAGLFSALAAEGIPVTMIVQNAPDAGLASITFTVCNSEIDRSMSIVRAQIEDLGAEGLMQDDDIVRLSVSGADELEHATGIAGEFFRVLADGGVNVLAINATQGVVSCIIELSLAERALTLLNSRYHLEVGTLR